MSGSTLASSIPAFTARAMYSGNSTADWAVLKNFSSTSDPSSPSSAVPRYCSLGSSFSSTWVKDRPASWYIPFSSLTLSNLCAISTFLL